jgi:hypothetical protein
MLHAGYLLSSIAAIAGLLDVSFVSFICVGRGGVKTILVGRGRETVSWGRGREIAP